MKALLIDRGVYRIGMRNLTTGEEKTGGWTSDPDGGCVVIGDIPDGDPTNDAENGTLVGTYQHHTLAKIIAERLNLPPCEEIPDIKKIARAMREDDIRFCAYCDRLDCRECIMSDIDDEEGGDGE